MSHEVFEAEEEEELPARSEELEKNNVTQYSQSVFLEGLGNSTVTTVFDFLNPRSSSLQRGPTWARAVEFKS